MKRYVSIGLMSGTSLDGVDAAVLTTDGTAFVEAGFTCETPYTDEERRVLRSALEAAKNITDQAALPDAVVAAQELVTDRHVESVQTLLRQAGMKPGEVDVIGFHGQTILHRPENKRALQIGDGQRLANEIGIDVVCDFRSADICAGGQGAPFASLYHGALGRTYAPLCFLNLGGIGNLTWVGSDGSVIAFDTGPGNALLNDWMERQTGAAFDQDGRTALSGTVDQSVLQRLLRHGYFDVEPPKSLDRLDFGLEHLAGLSVEDGAATLAAFTAAAVARAATFLPAKPEAWAVCGGGRHNLAIMAALQDCLSGTVAPVETYGWRGDFIEAEAFAYLAVRSLLGLPLSLPSTTGVPRPLSGGVLKKAA